MNTICYCAAVRTAARKTTALYDSILAPAGVTLAQYSLLRRIQRAGTVSLTKLGRLAELDRSTVGRNVKAMEELGFVRTASAADQREAAVRLTPPAARRWSAPRRCGRKRSGGSRLRSAPPRPGGFGRLRSVFEFFCEYAGAYPQYGD